ncbi:uncharacterized protein [Linepithema humile]|uniref:uncharacterized protein n=1 Tax=Linepithema humile TaxID=83485 RepID=UPI0006238320|nr:PREDICTED: uncharacterized protein LOC105676557 [Linepithema humile]XP_012229985.1 PREDICTED: uncharacterized protein LOC105676557 [Linepithema humile]
MTTMIRLLLLSALLILQSFSTVCSANGDGGPNSPIFNLDKSALEKNIAAIFNKVAHSSATTKRSVPAYDAQVSASTTLSTVPSPLTTSATTSTTTASPSAPIAKYPAAPRATSSPILRDLPSYAPPSRALFTPPLPPEYLHPFADKPTLRGTNSDVHTGNRRPVPPPSLTPAHERIPIRPPDLPHSPSQVPEKHHSHTRNKPASVPDSREKSAESGGDADRKNNTNDTSFVTLHYPIISRILSGSNGRKQDIPDILLKPLATKSPVVPNAPPAVTTDRTTPTPSTTTPSSTPDPSRTVVTYPTIFNLPNTGRQDDDGYQLRNEHGGLKKDGIEIVDTEKLPYPQAQPPAPTSKRPTSADDDDDERVLHVDRNPLESPWRIAWSLHVYLSAIMFTIMALYSIYKIVRFNEATNLLTQSYFLAVHLLLTTVCTLRCFHLFYDAYNLGHSLPEPLSRVLMYLPAPLLCTAFATLMLYLARCSEAPSLNNSILSPTTLVLSSTVHIVLCVSLHVSTHVFGYQDEARILPLICQCIYVMVCVTLGLCYMYVYRVVRSQIHMVSNKAAGANHMMGADPTTVALSTAITTTIATALLFILMSFIQLYGIFGVQERPQPYPWLWWGWQFSARLVELAVCGLLAWVASLSQYPLREKQMQQHSAHSGFALFPCGSSTSTENMDDVLYPAICSTNQAIQNYTMRTGKQVYDDSFPLNTLPEHLNISGTFERHSIRKSGTMGHFPHEGRGSLSRHGNGIQTLRNSETRGRHTPVQGLHEQAAPTSGSTMLVAEDGFVRFRSLGAEDDELSDTQSMVGTHGRGSSLAGSVRYNARHPTLQHQHPHHQLQHSHPSQHQTHHQLYNNT